MSLCNEYETKFEFDMSLKLLSDFLSDGRTTSRLSKECIGAVKSFCDNIVDKETQLANYVRRYITNCMDVSTTSPVESMNKVIHQDLDVKSNVHADKGIKRIAEGTTDRIKRKINESLRSLNTTNTASCAPTSHLIIAKSQALADQNNYRSKSLPCARVSPNEWWCWCFSVPSDPKMSTYPWCCLLFPVRVRKIHLREKDGNHFLWCDCGYYDRIGLCCSHLYSVLEEMSPEQFHIRHWKVYDATYNDDSDLGRAMVKAQARHSYISFVSLLFFYL